MLYPKNIKINEQFILSQLTCLAIKKVLDSYTDDITIKWSNDIYWKEKKICGILIENSLFRDKIDKCIIGIGLNVNQEVFTSNAPNPVSLKQITGKEMDREKILSDIYSKLLTLYREMDFERIQHDYQPDGKLILTMENGERKEYYFIEVIALPNLPAGEIWGRTT